jgi:ADP-heptose:LPS heptosyltransferase
MSDIIIAPFANGDIRDWQPYHFSTLIGLLLERWEGVVRVVGARSQATRAAAIVRPYDATRVVSDCGRLAWNDLVAVVRGATCVIGNNSGITHLSASLGVPTVCVFGGSHRRDEWHPMGFSAWTISRAIGCAPCHLHRARDCPYDKACLDQIDPETVARAALAAMAKATGKDIVDGA